MCADAHAAALQILTPENTVIPATCWNAQTNDSLSWASRPISNDTNFVRILPDPTARLMIRAQAFSRAVFGRTRKL